eukprot:TRINITY_DN7321_c0_g2_i5.p1 TRINITY_DN7321_c0_g2~~TRINITY_DN7321_c0_g2_i5.p1  ORF type:complete len:400 (+),score=66.76 TRINITY_DN7321_c0_g2_i5:613-1812(+)
MASPEPEWPTVDSNAFELDRLSNQRYMSLFDLEVWYPALAHLTAHTVMLPIDRTHAEALIDRYRRHWNVGVPELCEQDQHQTLGSLSLQIDEALALLNQPAAFARLSTRSPKDAGQDPRGHPDAVSACVSELLLVGGQAATPGEQLKAALRSCGVIMKVNSGEDAVALLASSERTYTDLVRAVGDKEAEWAMGVVLRDWNDVDLGDEYRCVVCDGEITAVLQYNDMCHYPHVEDSISRVAAAVVDWFQNQVKDVIQYKHCILDVWAPPSGEIQLIEINPFGPATGIPFTGGWRGHRWMLQGGRDVFGDLGVPPEEEPDAHEGVYYKTGRVSGVLTRVAIAPAVHITEDYLEVAMPVLRAAMQQLKAQQGGGGAAAEDSQEPGSHETEGLEATKKGCVIS